MLKVFIKNKGESKHRLMPGLMLSYKTMNGLPTKWKGVYPPKEKIAEIFSVDHPLVMNTLHYADYEGIDVAASLERATGLGGPHLRALQLDMIWPDSEIIKTYKEKHPNISLVLQVGANAFKQAADDPSVVVLKLRAYDGAIDYVLLDKSMGRGLGMDAVALQPFIMAINKFLPHLGITVAGGLGPGTLYLAEPLVQEFPWISIDAQGKLRPSGNALDPIDWDMAEQYLIRALRMFT